MGEENLRRWQTCVGVLKIDTVWERVQELQYRSGKFCRESCSYQYCEFTLLRQVKHSKGIIMHKR